MKPSSTLFLALAMLAAPATAANVCVEFLEQHPGDSGWQQACLGWLETQQPGSSPASSGPQAGGAGGASASMSGGIEADAPVHVSASNPMLAEGNQNEAFIAVDPSNPMRIFTISKTAPFTEGLLAAYSTDGGSTWHPSTLGDDGDEEGEGDPWAVFTDQGTLFVSYLDGDPTTLRTVVLQSNDGGATFEAPPVAEVGSFVDRGSLATGPAGPAAPGATGSLWTTYLQAGTRIVVEGAALDAGGSPIEDFCGMGTGVFCVKEPNVAEGDATGAVRAGHIAVGPGGEVLVTYMRLDAATPRAGPTRIFAELDPDGLGPALFSPVPASGAPVLTTNVGFFEREFPPHEDRFITPLANLAWYRGSGRIYLASTIEDPVVKEETDIVLLHSDDDGMSWSDPWQVNQDSTGEVRSRSSPTSRWTRPRARWPWPGTIRGTTMAARTASITRRPMSSLRSVPTEDSSTR